MNKDRTSQDIPSVGSKYGKTLGIWDLTNAIEEVLQFGGRTTKRGRYDTSKAYKVARAVLGAIKKGLEEDGVVTIQGFGTFYINIRTPYMHNTPFYGNLIQTVQPDPRRLPAKKVVRFKPAKRLRKFVKEGMNNE